MSLDSFLGKFRADGMQELGRRRGREEERLHNLFWKAADESGEYCGVSQSSDASSELEHKSSRDFGAELVSREVVRSNHVAAYPYRPPSIVPPNIHSATHFVGKRCLGTKRGLRGKVRSSDERVSPEF